MSRSMVSPLTLIVLSLVLSTGLAQTPASPDPNAATPSATGQQQQPAQVPTAAPEQGVAKPPSELPTDEHAPAPVVRVTPPGGATSEDAAQAAGEEQGSRRKMAPDDKPAGEEQQGGEKTEKASKADKDKPLPPSQARNPVLWHDPGDIASKDLYHGQGGQKNYPKPPFTFLEEDKSGTNPKFDARDGNGKKWRVKLGEEAQPEVVASRLLWAVGYYANDDYNVPSADVAGLKLSRGGQKGEHIEFARFARKPGGQEKIATWMWKDNPFLGTREFDGLRVMMAVMNNWDLKDVNNSVYVDQKTGHEVFLVNDVGATFATNSLETSRAKDKGNLKSYKNSKFITKRSGDTVNFATPAAPTGVLMKSFGIRAAEYFRRSGFQWIGQNIPVDHARWIGGLLGKLSEQQLRDAFRAGNFPPEQADIFVDLVHNRILELQDL